ncbi:hypothetical protein GCM10027067_06700 [Pseudactinotalea suaedae]
MVGGDAPPPRPEDAGPGGPGTGSDPPRCSGTGEARGPKTAGIPTGYPLEADEYDVTDGFIDTG